MPSRASRPKRFSVVFPDDGTDPYAVLPLGSIWPGHPEAAAVAKVIWDSGGRDRDWAMSVADCIQARSVARRHAQGRDAHGGAVSTQFQNGAKRVLSKLGDCLRALEAAGVAGAVEALAADAVQPDSWGDELPIPPKRDHPAPGAAVDSRAWVVRAGKNGEMESHNLRHGVVTIGWDDWEAIDSLAKYENRAAFGQFIDRRFGQATYGQRRSCRDQMWRFYNDIAVGDLVVLPLKTTPAKARLIAIGRVVGPAFRDTDQPQGAQHRRPVEWLRTGVLASVVQLDLWNTMSAMSTVFGVRRNDGARRVRHLAGHGEDPGPDLSATDAVQQSGEAHPSTPAAKPMFVLTWNPDKGQLGPRDNHEEYQARVNQTAAGRPYHRWWQTGRRKRGINDGDEVVLLVHGAKSGIIASGRATGNIYQTKSGDNEIDVAWERWVSIEDRMPREALNEIAPWFRNRIQSSGQRLPDNQARALKHAWERLHTGATPVSGDEAGVIDDQGVVVEGAARTVSVNRYERSAWARQACVEHHGTSCAVCGIDFVEVYGDVGDGFIHVHHKTPISEVARTKNHHVDPIEDLVPVCPNCHAMLHRPKGKTLSVRELQRLMNVTQEAATRG